MSKLIPFPGAFEGDADESTTMAPAAQLALRGTAGAVRGQVFRFSGVPMVIGRSTSCHIVIPSHGVSRNHARIEYSDGAYWIVPEKTVNGTRVNGTLVLEPTKLADRDEIVIFDATFAVDYRDPFEDRDEDVETLQPQQRTPAPVLGEPGVRPSMPTMPGVVLPPDRAQSPVFRDSVPSFQPAAAPPYRESAPVLHFEQPAPRARARWWLIALVAVGFLGIVAAVVVVTAKMLQPEAAPAPAPTQIVMQPAPAPTPPPDAAVAAVTPPPDAAPAPEPPKPAVLSLDKVAVTAGERGTILDIGRAGARIARGGAIAHVRAYSAAYDQAVSHLASLQRQFGDSPDHADFIEQAREQVASARAHRQTKAIAAPTAATIAKVMVKPGAEIRADTVIAEISVARVTVPVAAVEGTGKKCTLDLDKGVVLHGSLLPVGETERTLELDSLPPKLAAGELGTVHVHCSGD